jgi:phage terminase Nu1 subunit (DNA packaging protein)
MSTATTAPTLLSQNGYAAHRRSLRLPGNTLRSVQDAIKYGRIVATEDGRIDPVAADIAWRRNTNGVKQGAKHQNGAEPGTYIEAKRQESIERARQFRLANDETEGRLVAAAEVEIMVARLVVESRNQLRGIPSRVKMRLPHLSGADVQAIGVMIDEALEELAGHADRPR